MSVGSGVEPNSCWAALLRCSPVAEAPGLWRAESSSAAPVMALSQCCLRGAQGMASCQAAASLSWGVRDAGNRDRCAIFNAATCCLASGKLHACTCWHLLLLESLHSLKQCITWGQSRLRHAWNRSCAGATRRRQLQAMHGSCEAATICWGFLTFLKLLCACTHNNELLNMPPL